MDFVIYASYDSVILYLLNGEIVGKLKIVELGTNMTLRDSISQRLEQNIQLPKFGIEVAFGFDESTVLLSADNRAALRMLPDIVSQLDGIPCVASRCNKICRN